MNCRPTGVKLGKGAYSTVIQLKSEHNETIHLAGKVFKAPELKKYDEEKLIKEISIMVGLNHTNIVACKGVCFLPTTMLPVLVMEQLETNLHDHLLDPGNSNLPMEKKASFLLDTARGLDYLHSRTPAIIHRDLTAKNVLLDSQLRAKIADFGNSRLIEYDPCYSGHGSMTAAPGTPNYMPPEAMGVGVTYDPSLDVFSFGHLALFTITQTSIQLLSPIFTDSTTGKLNSRSELERRGPFLEKVEKLLPENYSVVILIKQCLQQEPSERPKSTMIMNALGINTYSVPTDFNHPFLSSR